MGEGYDNYEAQHFRRTERAFRKVEKMVFGSKEETQRALIAELGNALEPMAKAADNFDRLPVKNPEEWFVYKGESDNGSLEPKGAVTVGDLRRARNAHLKAKAMS